MSVKERQKRHKVWFLEKNLFEELVKKAENIGKVLEYFSLTNGGRNNAIVKRRCLDQGIDITHWKLGKGSNKGRKFKPSPNKIKIENVLIENSRYNRTDLKARLINEGLIKYECLECGNFGEWKNKKQINKE